jgi:hypothetical protein
MKRIFIVIAVITILFLAEMPLLAQTYGVYDWSTSNYRRNLTKTSSSYPTSSGLSDISSEIEVGRYVLGGTTYYARSFYQWNITNDLIPDNVIIDTVQLRYEYRMLISGNHPFIAAFYNSINDLQSGAQNNLNTLWENSEDPFKRIESFQEGSQGVFEATYDPGSSMVYIIQQALSSDKFVLGIRYQHETSYDSVWYVKNSTVKLRIVFRYPDIPVTINQKLSNNSSVDSVGYWNSTTSKFDKYVVPKTFDWNLNSTRTLQGSQKLISSQKYNLWKKGEDIISDVTNHKSFVIDESYSGITLTSQFAPAHSGITIKNEFPEVPGLNPPNDSIGFFDPWLIDYPDSLYGNIKRNRGMDAQFKNRPSPFTPDYSTSYDGDVYNGVFLNQGYNPVNQTWQPPYYKVDIPEDQIISVNGQNRKFYPIGWGGSGVTIQSPGAETGIVFNSPNAVAIATLKGQLMSNSTTGISSNSQRKMVRTDNGIYHLVYESMGNVYYTHSLTSNFDGSWSQEELLRTNAKNPAIEYHVNNVKIVFEFYDPVYGDDAIIYLSAYAPNASGVYTQVVNECEEVANFPVSYFGNAKPVISYNQVQLFIAYRKNSTEGLKERTKWLNINTGLWNWSSEAAIPGTNLYSINPSVVESYAHIHLVYESQNSIMYKYAVTESYAGPWQYEAAINVSTGSGFTKNNYPNISISNGLQTYLLVSWLGVKRNWVCLKNDLINKKTRFNRIGF